jgi:hypothetical protein
MRLVPGFTIKWYDRARTKPWLILGKGPSFSRRGEFNFSGYFTIGINQTVCECETLDVSHITDLDVLDSAGDCLLAKTKTQLVMPYFPHKENYPDLNNSVDKLVTDTSFKHQKLLKSLLDQGRLFTYNSMLSAQACTRKDIGPRIPVILFSGVAVVYLLASMAVKDMTLIGIDGGKTYSDEFSHLTPLTNGHANFDGQFAEIQKVIARYNLRLKRVNP